MSFPTIGTSATSVENADETTHDVSLPASIAAGDLLIVLFTSDEAPTFTWPGGWTQLVADTANGTTVKTGVRYRIATGSEGATIQITTDTGQQSAHQSWRIPAGQHNAAVAPEAAVATGTSATPDPPNLAPTGGAKDYLWIEGFGVDTDDATVNYESTNYTKIAIVSSAGATAKVACAAAYRQLNASSENPGTMTCDASEEWIAFTIAVHPAVGHASYGRPRMPQAILAR